jgi:hypothetical protein
MITAYNIPAFPVPHGADYDGMTLRDYFAAKAMQSLILTHRQVDQKVPVEDRTISIMAYSLADAMLSERNK